MKTALQFKKLIALLLCLAVLFTCSFSLADQEDAAPADAEAEAQTGENDETAEDATVELTDARMGFLYEETTDTILFEKNPDDHNAPASMTKVMTAVLVLESGLDLNSVVTVPPEAVSPQYCSWMDTDHLIEGEEVKVIELLKYLLIPSGNEAATTLAMCVTGDIPKFIEMMNEKALELGMTETHYEDPHGLSSDSYISARDMVTLSRYAMQFTTFRNIVRMKGGSLPVSNKRQTPLNYYTTNCVMDPGGVAEYKTSYNQNVIGVKTGSTPAAGKNQSCCMVKDDLTFYSVVMHCSASLSGTTMLLGHYTESIKLLNFAQLFEKQGYAAGDIVSEVKLWGDLYGDAVALTAKDDVYILGRESKELVPEIELNEIGSSVKQGDVIGRAVLRDEFGNVRETELVVAADAEKDLTMLFVIIGGAVVLAAAIVVLVVVLSRKKKAAANNAETKADDQAKAE